MSSIGETTIGELIKRHGGSIKTGPFGTVLKAHEYTAEGVPLISVKEIGVGRFNVDSSTPKVSPEITERLPEYLLETGDLVFARKGAVDRSAMIDTSEIGWFLGSDGIRLRPPETCNPRYIAYFFQSNRTQRWLLQHATGTTMPSLNNKIIEAVPITIPLRDVQDRIAEILCSLDEKIELNRKQNRTLEAIAQALFKRWFVKFEFPDENGQPYKSSGGTMQPSELGEIPVGWAVVPFSETVELIGGGTPKTSIPEYWGGDIPWFSVVDAPSGSDTFVISTEKHITQAGVDNSSTKVLRAGITIISARGTVGRLSLIGKPMAMNQSCYGIQGKADSSDYFTHLLLQRALGELKASAHGSVFDTITRTTFDNLKVVKPIDTVIRDFEQVVAPFFQKLLSNCEHSVSLANLRDTLLPILMSGELRVGKNKE